MNNISFTQSSTNSICFSYFTITEAIPYFTWKLVDKVSSSEIVFYAENTSPFPLDYNCFIINIGDINDPLNGMITAPDGDYDYTIYQMPSGGDLDIKNAITIALYGDLQIIN